MNTMKNATRPLKLWLINTEKKLLWVNYFSDLKKKKSRCFLLSVTIHLNVFTSLYLNMQDYHIVK